MRIICYGARANTPKKCDIYQQRTLVVIQSHHATIWIDCAQSWQENLESISEQPDAIFITHAHEDHVGGLRNGSPAPVYASPETWKRIHNYSISDAYRHTMSSGASVTIGDMQVTAYNVYHSDHAPAQAYRVHNNVCSLMYTGDIAAFEDPKSALSYIDMYIGDGSIVEQKTLLRNKDGKPVGHAPISDQIAWCAKHNIHHALFIHCGANIIRKPYEEARAWIQDIGKEYGVYADIAYDGDQTTCHEFLS